MVTNLKYFRVTNIDMVEKPISILFEDNKTFTQLGKDISNIKKIKYINTSFYKVKNKSRKGIIHLEWVPNN